MLFYLFAAAYRSACISFLRRQHVQFFYFFRVRWNLAHGQIPSDAISLNNLPQFVHEYIQLSLSKLAMANSRCFSNTRVIDIKTMESGETIVLMLHVCVRARAME